MVERHIVHPGITLDYEITEIGGLDRQVVASIDDDHLLSRIVQPAGYQAAKRTEADDDYMVARLPSLCSIFLFSRNAITASLERTPVKPDTA